MPANLSARASDTGRFYSAIHDEIAPTAPTLTEFRQWLAATFPSAAGLRALDAGCGAHALNARACLARGFAVDAIDLNEDAAARGADIGVLQGSILDLPYEAETFDLAISTGVIHHTPDPARAFRELHRVTKRGGLAYISLYAFRGSIAHWGVSALRLMARAIPFRAAHRLCRGVPFFNNFVLDHAYVPILWLYTADEAREAMKSAGFTLETDWRSAMDTLPPALTGGGLLRVFVCRKH